MPRFAFAFAFAVGLMLAPSSARVARADLMFPEREACLHAKEHDACSAHFARKGSCEMGSTGSSPDLTTRMGLVCHETGFGCDVGSPDLASGAALLAVFLPIALRRRKRN